MTACTAPFHITHWSPMLKQWPGMVKWSISSLLFAVFMIYDCRHPCHITHWSPMLKRWPGKVQWSVSALLLAISMIYDSMHPCDTKNGLHAHLSHYSLTISMIYDCMDTCHITHWSQMAISSWLSLCRIGVMPMVSRGVSHHFVGTWNDHMVNIITALHCHYDI